MPCYSPLKAYRAKHVNPSGKRGIVFNVSDGYRDRPVEVPCGQCIGCRLEKSRQWAMRCVHEASLYEDNCFITLTYSPEHLPTDGGLVKAHFQKFMKRLRRNHAGRKIRYFHCGEYGEENLRPHYHACLFNFDFKDKVIFKTQDSGNIYTSDSLNTYWGMGFTTVGDVTFDSAAYVARYVMKKVTGDKKEQAYQRTDPGTGEIHNVIPEYTTMSRRPGIAREWYEKYREDCYPSDTVILNGKKMQPPKYYDNILEKQDEEELRKTKIGRRKRAIKRKDENTTERLLVREKVKKAQITQLKRQIEE